MTDSTRTTGGTNWAAVGAIGGIAGVAIAGIGLYLSMQGAGTTSVSASAAGGPFAGWFVTARGEGFEGGELVQATIGGLLFDETSVRALDSGLVFVSTNVPNNWTPGDYEVVLKGLVSQRTASAMVRLSP